MLTCTNPGASKTLSPMYTKRFKHISPVLIDLHWLPVRYRILFRILVPTYKTLHGIASHYIQCLLIHYTPNSALQSADKLSLVVPHSNTFSYNGWAFSQFAPSNSICSPSHSPRPHVVDIQIRFKTYLFKHVHG